MPLVTSRGYQLSPDILGGVSRGLQLGGQFQTQQLARQKEEQEMAAQRRQQALMGQIFAPQGAGTSGSVAQQPQQPMPPGSITPGPSGQALPPISPRGVGTPPIQAGSRDQAIAQLFATNPKMGDQVLKSIGILDARKATEAANFSFDLENTPFEQRQAKINARAGASNNVMAIY